MYLETLWVKTTEFDFVSAQIPEEFDNLKIVFVSDIHHGPFSSIERVSELVNKINEINPEIVIFGGDYVHRGKKYIKPVFQELAKVNPKNAKFGVLGNHDYWDDAVQTAKSMKEANILNIENNSFTIKQGKDSIKIGGVGDLWENKQDLNATTHNISAGNFCILVSHNPDYNERLNTDKIDLMLSGHTHGGQVSFFGLWSPILPSDYGQKYRYGLIETEKRSIYISSGFGTVTAPVRFFMRPEIVVITLKRE